MRKLLAFGYWILDVRTTGSTNKIRRVDKVACHTAPVLALAALLLSLVSLPYAQTSYARQYNAIKSGVLLLYANDSTTYVPANPNPFVWYNLDQNFTAKPAGWTFENPMASTVATQDMQSRWNSLSTLFGGSYPNPGDRLTKSEAGYWEVPLLTASDNDLAEFNVLSISIYDKLSLVPFEREKLRNYVDQGGVLWIDSNPAVDTSSLVVDETNNLPLPIQILNSGSGTYFSDFFHPVLSYPNLLDSSSVASMQVYSQGIMSPVSSGDLGAIQDLQQTLVPDSAMLQTVVRDSTGTTVAVGRLGNGFIVITTRGVARALNRALTGGSYVANRQFYAQTPTFDESATAAARMVVNAISLTSTHNMPAQGSRSTNGSPADLGAPLLKRWSDTSVSSSPGDRTTYPPALYKGLLVVSINSGSSGQLFVYSATPGADLDGTGQNDKGTPDFRFGLPQDLLWSSQILPGPISAPTCVEVPNPSGGLPKDQILVTASDGKLYAFDAFNLDVNGRINAPPNDANVTPKSTVFPPLGGVGVVTTSVPALGPFAPTVHEGLVYVADSQTGVGGNPVGRVWLMNPATGAVVTDPAGAEFAIGGAAAAGINDISASPTVAYIPIQDNSGGLDKVVYVPTRPNPMVGGPTSTAGLTSIWVGARGEKPSDVQISGGDLVITTRASLQGLSIYAPATNSDPLGFKLSVVDSDGNLWDGAAMASHLGTWNQPIGSPGVIHIPISGVSSIDGYQIRVDYTIDWGVNGSAPLRGNLFFPDDSARSRRIIGNLALSSKGVLFAVVSTQDDTSINAAGGDLYAVSEQGRGTFKLLYRFSLYGPHGIIESQGDTVNYPETLYDYDGITSYSVLLQGSMSNITFAGAPAVSGNVVYVPARGFKGSGLTAVPVTVMMAFKADPEPVEIRVAGDLSTGFRMAQPEVTASDNKAIPERTTLVLSNQYNYTKPSGATYGTIHMDSLMSSQRGLVQNAVSVSQPLLIHQEGQADQLVEPNAGGGTWNPLLWYACFNGYDTLTAPAVAGNTLYFAGKSGLPSILSGGSFTNQGILVGMNSNIAETDPMNISDTTRARPWLTQVPQVVVSPSFQTNPNFRWPQLSGSGGFAGFKVKLGQTVMTGSTDAYGIAVGESTLAAVASNGVFAYGLADFLVADEGRLARFDSAGNPLYESDSSLQTGLAEDVSNVGNVKPLVRPTRAYPLSATDMVVVDTGSNRLARVGLTGREVRSIDKILLDPSFRPDGYNTNEPLTFNSPRDAVVFSEYVTVANDPATSTLGYKRPDGTFVHVTIPGAESTGSEEFWIHYLVADGGNRRLVELVDRFNADATTNQVLDSVKAGSNNTPQLGVLVWHSPAVFSGKNWEYNAVARVFVASGTPRYVVAAGIGSASATRSDTGLTAPTTTSQREEATGNGGIVVFDGANSQAISQVNLLAQGANTIWDWSTGAFNPGSRIARKKKLSSLSSVTMKNVSTGSGTSQLAIMFTDSSGVYEISPESDPTADWDVTWMLTNDAYRAMRGINAPYGAAGQPPTAGAPGGANPDELRATYARRLPSNEVLIVNGYSGFTKEGGNASGGSSTTLTDATKNWTPGAYIGLTVQILSGTGAGQTSTISSNDATTLTVGTAWATTPDNTSTYVIYHASRFQGEVIQVNGDTDPGGVSSSDNTAVGFSFNKTNFGFGSNSIRFQLGPIQGARGLQVPVFADRR